MIKVNKIMFESYKYILNHMKCINYKKGTILYISYNLLGKFYIYLKYTLRHWLIDNFLNNYKHFLYFFYQKYKISNYLSNLNILYIYNHIFYKHFLLYFHTIQYYMCIKFLTYLEFHHSYNWVKF